MDDSSCGSDPRARLPSARTHGAEVGGVGLVAWAAAVSLRGVRPQKPRSAKTQGRGHPRPVRRVPRCGTSASTEQHQASCTPRCDQSRAVDWRSALPHCVVTWRPEGSTGRKATGVKVWHNSASEATSTGLHISTWPAASCGLASCIAVLCGVAGTGTTKARSLLRSVLCESSVTGEPGYCGRRASEVKSD